MKSGVRLSSLLSPFLFLAALDWIMKTSTAQGRHRIQWTSRTQLDDLNFVDDLALLSHPRNQRQAKTVGEAAAFAEIGFDISKGKGTILKHNSQYQPNHT